MKYLKDIVYVIIIIAILIIAKDWIKDKLISSLGGFTDKEVETKVDSTYQEGKIDTIALFNHYVQTQGINLNPKGTIEYRYKYLDPVTDVEMVSDSIKKFDVTVNDSLIDGTFTVFNNFKGDLLNSFFNYKAKFPKYITGTDTVRIGTTTTETLSNKRGLIGIGVGYNNLQFPSVLGSYTTKNKWQFIYEYGKPMKEAIQIIDGAPFKTPKQDLHSLKILKHF